MTAAQNTADAGRTEELAKALDRADKLIWAMAAYIGKMALYDEAIMDLNEHGLFVEKCRRNGVLPRAVNKGAK